MPHLPNTQIIRICGRISEVRWLEEAPWHAQKVKVGKYWRYDIAANTLSDAQKRTLSDRITGDGYGIPALQGVWFEDGYAPFDAELIIEDDAEWTEEPLHSAFERILPYASRWMRDHDDPPIGYQPTTNEDVIRFLVWQIDTLLAPRWPEALAELASIKADIEQRGGDAYAEHMVRLQEFARRDAKGDPRLILNFGKYKGQAIAAVVIIDHRYVQWLSLNASKPEVRSAALTALQQ